MGNWGYNHTCRDYNYNFTYNWFFGPTLYDCQCILFAPRLHEICEGHRLLTLRGRGSELQAVRGLKINRQKRRLFGKEELFSATWNRLRMKIRVFFFASGVLKIRGF